MKYTLTKDLNVGPQGDLCEVTVELDIIDGGIGHYECHGSVGYHSQMEVEDWEIKKVRQLGDEMTDEQIEEAVKKWIDSGDAIDDAFEHEADRYDREGA